MADGARVTGDGKDDALSSNRAALRFHPQSYAACNMQAGHCAVLDDPHAVHGSGTRVSPGYGIVPYRTAAALQKAPDDGISSRVIEIDLGSKRGELASIQERCIDPGQAHGVAPLRGTIHLIIRGRQLDDAAWAIHHIEVELSGKRLPASQGVLIKVVILRQEVVRPDHRGIAAHIAVADDAAVEYADPRNAVLPGEIVRCREAVSPGSDDDHLIAILWI